MQYWWVSQNQTYKQEISNGYMWSPKLDRNGNRIHFYDNMKATTPGDLVFSFYNKKIQQVGIIQHTAITTEKPEEFGSTGDYWNKSGWWIPVTWVEAVNPISPKEIISELRPHLNKKYNPIKDDGSGNQIYLANVSLGFAETIFKYIGINQEELISQLTSSSADIKSLTDYEDKVEEVISNDTSIGLTEKTAIIQSRRGQGKFRKNLSAIEKTCRVSKVEDKRILIASHIKPWVSCENNHERLDGNNGLLLAPHIDKLFDQGYISFSDDGDLLTFNNIQKEEYLKLGIDISKNFNVGAFNNEQKIYLEFHRENIFRAPSSQ